MRFAKVISLLMALCLSFAAGALAVTVRHWHDRPVTVRIVNTSGLDVRTLSLIAASSSGTTTLVLRPLGIDEQSSVRFQLAGEGAFHLEAVLSNGRVIKGGGGYVEPGYTSTETIRPDKIDSGPGRLW